MAIRVLFDSTEINSNYIVGLKQSVNPYGEYFKIGNTICRQFTLDVLNDGFSTIPNKVYLYDNQTIYATLNIDNVDTENTKVTSFTLVDTMVMFNQDLTYTTGQTVKQILESVCATFGISLATQSFYMSDLAITWTDELKIRDFISYVAEVNGGYAYINASGNLVIESYSPTAQATINLVDCSSIKIGSKHLYDRVYVELAAATKYYPQTSSNDTLYLNPNNILFTDSGSYTIDATIQHIQSVINGLTFYNINIEKCPIQNVRTGQIIRINDNGTYTPFICTIDTTYNAKWNGGYNMQISSSKQEETKVVNDTDAKINRINIKVDRVAGEIRQEVSDLDEQVTASLLLKVDKTDNDQIISMINASADNIILNTKSLIFGVYPDGQYIEVKNYYSNNVAIGVLFNGSGNIRMTPTGKYEVINKNTTTSWNSIILEHNTNTNANNVYIRNYNFNNNVAKNELNLISTSTGSNTIYLTNRFADGTSIQYANQISMMVIGSTNQSAFSISNYNHNTFTYGNRISCSAASSVNRIDFDNYNPDGENYISNSISMSKRSDWNSNSITMYCSSTNIKMAAIYLGTQTGVTINARDRSSTTLSSGISLATLDLNGSSVANVSLRTDGKVFINAGNDLTVLYQGIFNINGNHLKFQNGYVMYD